MSRLQTLGIQLIDREKICKFHYDEINRKYGAEPYEYGEDIVRCKECKKHNTHRCHMAFDLVATNDDDFCSYGERREP